MSFNDKLMEFKIITISLANHIVEQLQNYCDRTGQKQTDVIRQSVYEFLNNPYITSTSDFIECNCDSNESD